MVRSIRRLVPVCLGLLVAVSWLTPTAEAKEPNPIVQLAKRMNQPVDFPGIDNPKATLSDALAMLAKKYGLSFEVREDAFKMLDVENGPSTRSPVAETPIPKMTHVRLGTVLQKILDRISAPSGVVYVLRRDGIEITTWLEKAAEFYPHAGVVDPVTAELIDPSGDSQAPFRRLLPLIHVEFDKRPLGEALQELADATDWTVVLDEQSAEKVKPVTATLVNVPLCTAVKLLADMSGLTVVRRNKSLYLTTKEKAAALPMTPFDLLNRVGMGLAGGVGGLQAGQSFSGNFQVNAAHGMGLGGGIVGLGGIGGIACHDGFQGGGGISGGNRFQPSGRTPLPSTLQPPTAATAAKPASSDLAKIQTDIAKLQVEIAKLQAELARLQLRTNAPQKQEKGGPEPKGVSRQDPADRGQKSEMTKPRTRLARKR